MARDSLGELEHLILLAILGLPGRASALRIRERLREEGRGLTRGALYRSLDRLGEKGMIEWDVDAPGPDRGGHARRIYRVSDAGVAVVRDRRATLERLWAGAEGRL